MLDLSAAFALDYPSARSKFLDAARACSLEVERHVHPTARGAQEEDLSIDVGLLGDPRASRLLLVTSGMHGVEGFAGSGCQVALLRDSLVAATLKATKSALLLCHAVNPYGFSHLRRVNEDNVDLNRNFRDFASPASRNDAYAELHATIVPDAWPPTPANSATLARYVARFGIPAVQSALTRGQSDFPNGLFYAGRTPAWSNRILRDILARHGRDRARLGWIDLHTGLGPWAHGEKIHLGPDDAAMIARTRCWFGGDVTTVYDGTATSAELTGVCYHAALDACPAVEYTGITLEFGIRPLAEVLLALRAEQWLANHPAAGAMLRDAIKRQMREAFYDDSPTWQAMAYAQSRVAVLQALRGLAS